MRSLGELVARELVWQADVGMAIDPSIERHIVLWDGQEPVVTAQIMWERQKFFDVILECGEGTYQAHIDMTRPDRMSVAWKTGEDHSLAGLIVTSEGLITCEGLINTNGGRRLVFAPTRQIGYEYTIFAVGGPRLLTLAAFGKGIGGNPGHMSIEPEEATDVEMPALVAMAFAVANEQVRLLHRDETQGYQGSL
jgi:hypothetical protein